MFGLSALSRGVAGHSLRLVWVVCETLTRVERMARDLGLTRAGLLNLFIHRGLDREGAA